MTGNELSERLILDALSRVREELLVRKLEGGQKAVVQELQKTIDQMEADLDDVRQRQNKGQNKEDVD